MIFIAIVMANIRDTSRAERYQKNDDGTVLVQNITVLLNITVLHK